MCLRGTARTLGDQDVPSWTSLAFLKLKGGEKTRHICDGAGVAQIIANRGCMVADVRGRGELRYFVLQRKFRFGILTCLRLCRGGRKPSAKQKIRTRGKQAFSGERETKEKSRIYNIPLSSGASSGLVFSPAYGCAGTGESRKQNKKSALAENRLSPESGKQKKRAGYTISRSPMDHRGLEPRTDRL